MRELLQSKIPVALPTMVAIQSFGTMCGYAGAVVAALIGSNGHNPDSKKSNLSVCFSNIDAEKRCLRFRDRHATDADEITMGFQEVPF